MASLKGPGAASKTQLARNSNIITNFSPKNKICFYLLKVTLAFTALLSPFRSPTTSIICSTCTCTMRTMCTAHAQCAQDVHIAHNSTSSHLQLGMALMAPTGALDTLICCCLLSDSVSGGKTFILENLSRLWFCILRVAWQQLSNVSRVHPLLRSCITAASFKRRALRCWTNTFANFDKYIVACLCHLHHQGFFQNAGKIQFWCFHHKSSLHWISAPQGISWEGQHMIWANVS